MFRQFLKLGLRSAPGIVALATILLALSSNATWARADYTPPYPQWNFNLGAGGTYVVNYGTAIDPVPPSDAWDSWTGYNQLIPTGSPSGCGTSVSCVYFVNEGATIPGTVCAVPSIGDSGGANAIKALVYALAGNQSTLCGSSYASPTFPIFVINVNSSLSFTVTDKTHIGRHELGHALSLPDAPSESCYFVNPAWYPLMRNNYHATTCSTYPQNGTATPNEISWATYWAYLT